MKQFSTQSKRKNFSHSDKPHVKYRNIIFDLGGVLLSFDPKQILKSTFKDEKVFPWEFLDAVHTPEWLAMNRGTATFEDVARSMVNRFEYEKFLKFLWGVYDALAPLEDGMLLFDEVRKEGYKTYILSNMGQEGARKVRSFDNFLPKFDGAIFSSEVKTIKPEPEVYQILLDTYDLKASECLFLDDMERNIVAGQKIGIDGIVYSDYTIVLEELKSRGVI